MTRVIFHTATTLNGYLADDDDSLSWLFVVDRPASADDEWELFMDGIGALVMGSTTYEWILDHEKLLENPDKWFYPDTVSVVLSSRTLPVVPNADIRMRSGDVSQIWTELVDAAGAKDVWLVGGGDLAGQFADAGLLDEIRVSVAPVTLASGRPLLPRRLESDRLRLESVRQVGQFAELVYSVRPASAS